MPQWNRVIDLRPAVEIYKSTGVITRTASKAVEIIEASGWLDDTPYPDTLRDHLGALRESVDQYDYEATFDYIYDAADRDRVWIETT